MKTSELLELVHDKLITVGWRADAKHGPDGARCLGWWVLDLAAAHGLYYDCAMNYLLSALEVDMPSVTFWNDQQKSVEPVLDLVQLAISAALSDGD